MKNIFCLLLAAFAVTVAGNELATGSNDMGKLAASCLKKGDVKPFRDGDREIALDPRSQRVHPHDAPDAGGLAWKMLSSDCDGKSQYQ